MQEISYLLYAMIMGLSPLTDETVVLVSSSENQKLPQHQRSLGIVAGSFPSCFKPVYCIFVYSRILFLFDDFPTMVTASSKVIIQLPIGKNKLLLSPVLTEAVVAFFTVESVFPLSTEDFLPFSSFDWEL